MAYEYILISQTNGISTIKLNRPTKRNALHQPMVKELLTALNELAQDPTTRLLMIQGQGEHFCAGGDIAWMQKMASNSNEENVADADCLAEMLYQFYCFPRPTIALVNGVALGGGFGLVCASDIALSATNARFGLPEVKVGVTPSIISPYVVAALGQRLATYYVLTGEQFDAKVAQHMGLVHQVAHPEELMNAGFTLAGVLLKNGPQALIAAKKLIHENTKAPISESLSKKMAEHLAHIRTTGEAQEGFKAFLEKRSPNWEINHDFSEKSKNS